MSTDDWKRYDKYYTPEWPVRLLLDQWESVTPADTIAEPCCGRGDVAMTGVKAGYEDWILGDLRPDDNIDRWWPALQVDATLPCARQHYLDSGCSAVITNPPYSAETGTAGEVLEAIVGWGLPTAALLRISWLEPCQDRVWAWLSGGTLRPSQVMILPRVEYTWPEGADKEDGNPATSVWVIWEPEAAGLPQLRHFGPAARERYQGQMTIEGVGA